MLPLLVQIDDLETKTTSRLVLLHSPIRVGRNAMNDLVLDRPFVSHWHAMIEFDAERTRYTDLGSTNGTLYNGHHVSNQAMDVSATDTLDVGALRMTFVRAPVPPELQSGSSLKPFGGGGSEAESPATSMAGAAPWSPPAPQAPAPAAAPAPAPYVPPAAPAHAAPASWSPPASPPMPSGPPSLGGPAAPPPVASPRGRDDRYASTDIVSAVALPPPHLATMAPTAFGYQPGSTGASSQTGGGRSPGNVMSTLAQMQAASAGLTPLYNAYHQAWAALYAGVQGVVEQTPAGSHELTFELLGQNFPELSENAKFRALAAARGVSVDGGAGGSVAHERLRQLAEYLRAEPVGALSGTEVDALLHAVVTVLEAFGTAFIALSRGQGQFTSSVPGSRRALTALEQVRDARAVLAYLFGPAVQGESRVDELRRAYAGIMVHQVSLLGGLMQGVRSLLKQLGPATIEREVAALPVKRGPLAALRRFFGGDAQAYWQRYTQRHQEFTGEDRELTEAIFGPEFARAYSAFAGERYGGPARK